MTDATNELVQAVKSLLNCTELNMDDMEDDTIAVIERTQRALERLEAER